MSVINVSGHLSTSRKILGASDEENKLFCVFKSSLTFLTVHLQVLQQNDVQYFHRADTVEDQ